MTSSKRRRKLTQADLRAMDVSPGLLLRRVDPEGRTRLEEITRSGGRGGRRRER